MFPFSLFKSFAPLCYSQQEFLSSLKRERLNIVPPKHDLEGSSIRSRNPINAFYELVSETNIPYARILRAELSRQPM